MQKDPAFETKRTSTSKKTREKQSRNSYASMAAMRQERPSTAGPEYHRVKKGSVGARLLLRPHVVTGGAVGDGCEGGGAQQMACWRSMRGGRPRLAAVQARANPRPATPNPCASHWVTTAQSPAGCARLPDSLPLPRHSLLRNEYYASPPRGAVFPARSAYPFLLSTPKNWGGSHVFGSEAGDQLSPSPTTAPPAKAEQLLVIKSDGGAVQAAAAFLSGSEARRAEGICNGASEHVHDATFRDTEGARGRSPGDLSFDVESVIRFNINGCGRVPLRVGRARTEAVDGAGWWGRDPGVDGAVRPTRHTSLARPRGSRRKRHTPWLYEAAAAQAGEPFPQWGREPSPSEQLAGAFAPSRVQPIEQALRASGLARCVSKAGRAASSRVRDPYHAFVRQLFSELGLSDLVHHRVVHEAAAFLASVAGGVAAPYGSTGTVTPVTPPPGNPGEALVSSAGSSPDQQVEASPAKSDRMSPLSTPGAGSGLAAVDSPDQQVEASPAKSHRMSPSTPGAGPGSAGWAGPGPRLLSQTRGRVSVERLCAHLASSRWRELFAGSWRIEGRPVCPLGHALRAMRPGPEPGHTGKQHVCTVCGAACRETVARCVPCGFDACGRCKAALAADGAGGVAVALCSAPPGEARAHFQSATAALNARLLSFSAANPTAASVRRPRDAPLSFLPPAACPCQVDPPGSPSRRAAGSPCGGSHRGAAAVVFPAPLLAAVERRVRAAFGKAAGGDVLAELLRQFPAGRPDAAGGAPSRRATEADNCELSIVVTTNEPEADAETNERTHAQRPRVSNATPYDESEADVGTDERTHIRRPRISKASPPEQYNEPELDVETDERTHVQRPHISKVSPSTGTRDETPGLRGSTRVVTNGSGADKRHREARQSVGREPAHAGKRVSGTVANSGEEEGDADTDGRTGRRISGGSRTSLALGADSVLLLPAEDETGSNYVFAVDSEACDEHAAGAADAELRDCKSGLPSKGAPHAAEDGSTHPAPAVLEKRPSSGRRRTRCSPDNAPLEVEHASVETERAANTTRTDTPQQRKPAKQGAVAGEDSVEAGYNDFAFLKALVVAWGGAPDDLAACLVVWTAVFCTQYSGDIDRILGGTRPDPPRVVPESGAAGPQAGRTRGKSLGAGRGGSSSLRERRSPSIGGGASLVEQSSPAFGVRPARYAASACCPASALAAAFSLFLSVETPQDLDRALHEIHPWVQAITTLMHRASPVSSEFLLAHLPHHLPEDIQPGATVGFPCPVLCAAVVGKTDVERYSAHGNTLLLKARGGASSVALPRAAGGWHVLAPFTAFEVESIERGSGGHVLVRAAAVPAEKPAEGGAAVERRLRRAAGRLGKVPPDGTAFRCHLGKGSRLRDLAQCAGVVAVYDRSAP
ncbi:hypothetical protein DIPPA_28615 [Diplonema papillatum]|nr:hypothetical protein DIPPA_28615 [Diplonema papillatum]